MNYFDTRGVHRIYDVAVREDAWETSMGKGKVGESYAEGSQPFSQRTTYTFKDNYQTMFGDGEMARDDQDWEDDLKITYFRSE